MSCQNNANRTTGAAIKCGISGVASKAAYMAGGIAIGTGVGLVAGPVGALAGGVVGGVAGRRIAVKLERKRFAAAEEKRWQNSAEGKKARRVRNKALDKARLAYRAKVDPFKAREEKIKGEYKAAKQAWLGRQKGVASSTSVKEAISSPEARAAAESVGAAAITAAMRYSMGVSINRRDAVWMAAGTAMSYPGLLKNTRERLWQQSSEGQEAMAKYQKGMTNLKAQWKPIKREYKQKRRAIEKKYEQARDDFFLRGQNSGVEKAGSN
jgi:hypothetical protein